MFKLLIAGTFIAGEWVGHKIAEKQVANTADDVDGPTLLENIERLPDGNVLSLTKHHNYSVRVAAEDIARYRGLI